MYEYYRATGYTSHKDGEHASISALTHLCLMSIAYTVVPIVYPFLGRASWLARSWVLISRQAFESGGKHRRLFVAILPTKEMSPRESGAFRSAAVALSTLLVTKAAIVRLLPLPTHVLLSPLGRKRQIYGYGML